MKWYYGLVTGVFTGVGFWIGVGVERLDGPAAQIVESHAAAIEACSAEHNVHLASCEMQAVVVKGRDLLPFPDAMSEGQ